MTGEATPATSRLERACKRVGDFLGSAKVIIAVVGMFIGLGWSGAMATISCTVNRAVGAAVSTAFADHETKKHAPLEQEMHEARAEVHENALTVARIEGNTQAIREMLMLSSHPVTPVTPGDPRRAAALAPAAPASASHH